jgi:hypothetical protein
MDLRRHLRQTILHKRRTGQTHDREVTYSEPEEIPARVEEKARLGSTGQGAEILATTNIIVEAEVAIGDLVATDTASPRYEEVESRESYVDLAGRVLGYKLYLEPVTRS